MNFVDVRPFVLGSLEDATPGDPYEKIGQPSAPEATESWYLQRCFDRSNVLAGMRLAWDQFQLDKAAGICPVMSGENYLNALEAVRKNKIWGRLLIRAQFDAIVDQEFPEGLPQM